MDVTNFTIFGMEFVIYSNLNLPHNGNATELPELTCNKIVTASSKFFISFLYVFCSGELTTDPTTKVILLCTCKLRPDCMDVQLVLI